MSCDSSQSVIYAPPATADHDALRAMASRSFSDTFSHRYDPELFAAFLARAYGPGGSMAADLLDPAIRWLVAFSLRAPVGYAKLTPLRAPVPSASPARRNVFDEVGRCTFTLGDGSTTIASGDAGCRPRPSVAVATAFLSSAPS